MMDRTIIIHLKAIRYMKMKNECSVHLSAGCPPEKVPSIEITSFFVNRALSYLGELN
jgi:hypothetical protein